MQVKYFLVYRVENLLNGKYYIGAHETYDVQDGYMGSGKLLKAAIAKHGLQNFRRRVLRRCADRESMYAYEKKIISKHLGRKLCSNLAEGGKGGWRHVNDTDCPELQQRVRKSRQLSNEQRTQTLRSRYGVDPELTERCRTAWRKNALLGAKASAEARRGKPGALHTDETKALIGAANSVLQTGELNSQFGTTWISHDEVCLTMRVPRADVQIYLDHGWRPGRVMRYAHIKDWPIE